MFKVKDMNRTETAILQATENLLGVSHNNFCGTVNGNDIRFKSGARARNSVVLADVCSSVGFFSYRLNYGAHSCDCILQYRNFSVRFNDDMVISYCRSTSNDPVSMVLNLKYSELHEVDNYFNVQLEHGSKYKDDHVRMLVAMIPAMKRVLFYRRTLQDKVSKTSSFMKTGQIA